MMWSPLAYRKAAVVAFDAALELLSRLDLLMLKPEVIVDMGSGTGEITERLKDRYPNALVVGVDSSLAMCEYANEKHWQKNMAYIHGDANHLPLKDQAADLIFANFCLPWCNHPQSLLKEWRRILKPGGVILLTAFGPDTLKEWQLILNGSILPYFMDMHDLGDLLFSTFSYPVVEVDYYTVNYRKLNDLYQELYDTGMLSTFLHPKSNKEALAVGETFPMTLEIIFAHAFAPDEVKVQSTSDGVVKIPVDSLRRSRNPSPAALRAAGEGKRKL